MSRHTLYSLDTSRPCDQARLADVLNAVPIAVDGTVLPRIGSEDLQVTVSKGQECVAGAKAEMASSRLGHHAEAARQIVGGSFHIGRSEDEMVDHALNVTCCGEKWVALTATGTLDRRETQRVKFRHQCFPSLLPGFVQRTGLDLGAVLTVEDAYAV